MLSWCCITKNIEMSLLFSLLVAAVPLLWILSPIDVTMNYWTDNMSTTRSQTSNEENLTPRICIYFKTSTWKSLVNPWRALSTHCWTDRITNVRKLDNIVWSDASWDIWNSPFVSFWFWLKTARNVTKTTFLALFSPFSCLLPHGQVSALFCALIKSQSGKRATRAWPCRETWKKETFCKTRAILLYNVPFLIKCMSTSTIEPNQSSIVFDYQA